MGLITDFRDPGELRDGELRLVVSSRIPADLVKGYVPAYQFQMTVRDVPVGNIDLRLGVSETLIKYAGQIGYDVDEQHRGHHYAARSCRLLLPLARAHRFRELWITCDPANMASRRTCELAGAQLVEIVPLPEDNDQYLKGERFKCRYRLALSPVTSPSPGGR